MNLNKSFVALFLSSTLLSACATMTGSATVPMTASAGTVFASGLPGVESIIHDPKRGVFYASVQAGDVAGDGSIVRLSPEGKVMGAAVASGLDDPKGITLAGDKLYVADKVKLVEVNLTTGVITKIVAPDAQFLNDTVADDQGRVYVSDTMASSIYRLEDGKMSLWLKSPDLENPNGLLVDGNDLYVAAWGAFTDGKILEAPYGHLLKANLQTKVVKKLSAEPLGNLDGIEKDAKGGFVISDWKQGAVFSVTLNGEANQLIDVARGAGDLYYSAKSGLLLIPMAADGQILRYVVK